jgi:hypothetical protein
MPTMKAVQTAGSGVIEVVEVERPVPGPHRIPFTGVHHAFQLALTPGAAEKIIVAVGD